MSNETSTKISASKHSILEAYLSDSNTTKDATHPRLAPMATDEIIEELAPMARFTQDEINDQMEERGYVCERHNGQVMWTIFREPLPPE